MKKTAYKTAGCLAVGLGFAGAFLPLLPTTPFLLLAVFCFSRSSPRMNRWLLTNRLFGSYLAAYNSGEGMPRGVKAATIIFMWSGMLFTAFVFIRQGWLQVMLVVIALLVSVHIANLKGSSRGK